MANPTHEGPACREDCPTSRSPRVGNTLFSFSTVVRIISYTVEFEMSLVYVVSCRMVMATERDPDSKKK